MTHCTPNSDLEFRSGIHTLENTYRDCEVRLGRPATNIDVCEELGITLEELNEQLERYRCLNIGDFEKIELKEADESDALVRYAPFTNDEQDSRLYLESEFRRTLTEAVNALPKNEQLVVLLRYRHKQNLGEIAASFGFSEARVAQIHTTAMLRIRPRLRELRDRAPESPILFGQDSLVCLGEGRSATL